MQHIPQPNEIYKHFKGNIYQIITIAEHSEAKEMLVIYQAMQGDYKTYARPIDMFLERIDRKKYPKATQEYRFERVDKTSDAGVGQVSAAEEASMAEQAAAEQGSVEEQTSTAGQSAIAEQTSTAGQNPMAEQLLTAEITSTEDQAPIAEQISTSESISQEEQMPAIDPGVMKFLDADTYEERLDILIGLRHRLTDEMINVMAIATDIEVKSGNIEERYGELKSCLLKLEKFECNRLR